VVACPLEFSIRISFLLGSGVSAFAYSLNFFVPYNNYHTMYYYGVAPRWQVKCEPNLTEIVISKWKSKTDLQSSGS
jgi:hypothetical protein